MNEPNPPRELYSFGEETFATRKEANTYAQTSSRMFAGTFTVRYDGFAVDAFRQGRRVPE